MTHLHDIDDSGDKGTTLQITQIYSPRNKGLMLQLTQGYHFITLSPHDAREVALIIQSWAINHDTHKVTT